MFFIKDLTACHGEFKMLQIIVPERTIMQLVKFADQEVRFESVIKRKQKNIRAEAIRKLFFIFHFSPSLWFK